MSANWENCRTDLAWGESQERDSHLNALKWHGKGQEGIGFNVLLGIQDHNPATQKNYVDCRAEDQDKYWDIAFDVAREP